MKKHNVLAIFKSQALFICLTSIIIFTACGKDDKDAPTPGSIDAAIGTFKGKLTVYPSLGGLNEYFDAIVTVSKEGDKKLTVTPQSSSGATPKTFTVETQSTLGQAVTAVAGSAEGSFLYKIDVKALHVGTEQLSASESNFLFEGTKQ